MATPAGRGGISVVRLSGPDARAITAPMLQLKHELEPGRAVFGELVEAEERQVQKLSNAGGWGTNVSPNR